MTHEIEAGPRHPADDEPREIDQLGGQVDQTDNPAAELNQDAVPFDWRAQLKVHLGAAARHRGQR